MTVPDCIRRICPASPNTIVAMLFLCGFVPVTTIADETVSVARWQPHDFSFPTNADLENPFAIDLTALVSRPDGTSFTIPGFFDGRGTWKIRVAPTSEGEWKLTTKSDIPDLAGKSVSFVCVKNPNANAHGVLQVDKAHPHHFIYADGTRFFMQAYEYDWLSAC